MAHTAHTPGPWVLSPNGMRVRHKSPSGLPICLIEYGEERKANAALIASAPDLLEALNACFPYMHDLDAENFEDASVGIFEDHKLSAAFRKVKAAIAKATNIQQ